MLSAGPRVGHCGARSWPVSSWINGVCVCCPHLMVCSRPHLAHTQCKSRARGYDELEDHREGGIYDDRDLGVND